MSTQLQRRRRRRRIRRRKYGDGGVDDKAMQDCTAVLEALLAEELALSIPDESEVEDQLDKTVNVSDTNVDECGEASHAEVGTGRQSQGYRLWFNEMLGFRCNQIYQCSCPYSVVVCLLPELSPLYHALNHSVFHH